MIYTKFHPLQNKTENPGLAVLTFFLLLAVFITFIWFWRGAFTIFSSTLEKKSSSETSTKNNLHNSTSKMTVMLIRCCIVFRTCLFWCLWLSMMITKTVIEVVFKMMSLKSRQNPIQIPVNISVIVKAEPSIFLLI